MAIATITQTVTLALVAESWTASVVKHTYSQPMPHLVQRDLRHILFRRLLRNALLVGALVTGALLIGATGYHLFNGLSWLDATLNATMILTGMGPVNPIVTPGAKIFAIGYALFSGVFFLTMFAVLLAPALQHFLHRFHLDLSEEESQSPRGNAVDDRTKGRK